MKDTSKQRANDIFNDALERPPTERSAFLQSACADDVALRAQVDGFLAAHAEAGEFLASPTRGNKGAIPPIETVELKPLTEGPGAVIGRYKLLQPIGEGGFGVVYMAEQEEPVRRRVALKVIKLGMDTRQVVARFEAERQALAMMDHPHIARVFDGGATESGRPYFVMELVKGVPITQYCDDNNLTIPQRLGLFRQVCQAVQHAHQKGVIHRDLKPSNVMVTLHDGVPVPKVIDFGISKATNQRLTERTLFTEYGQFIGTPQYVAPEQAEMSGLDVDTRADIYSLGVLLYELLTGTTPLDAKSLRAAGYAEMQRMIKESESPKPSTRISTLGTANDVAKHRQTEPGKLSSALRGDLDWIVLKALEKDRTRRYETANDLAADLQRHLDDEPVLAGPPTAGYRLRKFVRRNRRHVFALLACTFLTAGLAIALAGVHRERTRRLAAQQREEVRSFLIGAATTPAGLQRVPAEWARQSEIIRGVCERIRSRQATSLDQEAFIRAFLEVRLEGRSLVALENGEPVRLRVGSSSSWPEVAAGLAMIFEPHIMIDGASSAFEKFSDGCLLLPLRGGRWSTWGEIKTPDTLGRHRVQGVVTVHIVEADYRVEPGYERSDHIQCDAQADRDYRLIPGMVIDVPLDAYEYTVVEKYPDGYPPRIVNEASVRTLENGLEVEVVVVPDSAGAQAVLGDQDVYGYRGAVFPILIVKASFPVLQIAMACEVTFAVPDWGWDLSLELGCFDSGSGSSSRWGCSLHPERGVPQGRFFIVERPNSDPNKRRHYLRFFRSVSEELANPSLSLPTFQFRMVASESAARREPSLSEYLDVQIERSVAIRHAGPE